MMLNRKIWYDAMNEMKIDAEPSRYHGLILESAYLTRRRRCETYTIVMIMHTAKARRMVRYLGARDEMSFPAGRTFSKVQLLSMIGHGVASRDTHENSAE